MHAQGEPGDVDVHAVGPAESGEIENHGQKRGHPAAGAYKSSEGMALLIREYEKPNVHKDVMIAIGHAARQWLDDERSWTLMRAMAASPQRDIARSLLNQYAGGLPVEARPRYLQLIIEIARHADPVVAREAFQAMSRWVNGSEEKVAASASQAILDLEDNTRWKAAMDTLIVACRDGKVNDQVIDVCTQLADTETKAEWNAAPERDLPERQRLVALIDKLTSLPPCKADARSLIYGHDRCA